jgi:biotin carboxyl carrier protein
MYTISVNGGAAIRTELDVQKNTFSGTIDGHDIAGDFIRISDHQYHLLVRNRSYNIDVVKVNKEEKQLVIRVNSVKYTIQLKDKYDELLHRLGMDNLAAKKVNDIKAPMPGMVLNILVSEGAVVKKGDALLVLEAMKMENIIKSPTDGTIKRIAATKGTAVEKNQLLIQF